MCFWLKTGYRTGLIGILCVALATGACSPEPGTDSSSNSTSNNRSGSTTTDGNNTQTEPDGTQIHPDDPDGMQIHPDDPDGMQIHPDDPDGSTTPEQTNNTSEEPTNPGQPTTPDVSDKLIKDMDSEELKQACTAINNAYLDIYRNSFAGEYLETQCHMESAVSSYYWADDPSELAELCEEEYAYCIEDYDDYAEYYDDEFYGFIDECIYEEDVESCDASAHEILGCLADRTETFYAYLDKYKGKTCTDLATEEMVESMHEDSSSTYSVASCDSVEEKCPELYIFYY